MSKLALMRIPGIGRAGVSVHREKSGLGIGALGQTGFDTNLSVQVIRDGKYDELGNLIPGTGYVVAAKEVMSVWSRFWGNVRGNDTCIDLGSGLVTNVGVLALANDPNWADPSGANNETIGLAQFHATGTGATAAAATDISLQTASTNGGQNPVTGTQVLVSAANVQKYQTVATISYTGSEAVTEWGLFTQNFLSATTGSPFTATSATNGTATATPFTASSSTVAGRQLQIVQAGTTAVWGLILSNSTSVLTIPAWYKTSDGTGGSTPGSTETFTLRPVMWDHKVFSAINVINGDSIQFTYTLTINSGG